MNKKNFESDIKNLKGTLAVEGMRISNEIYKSLKCMATGKTTYTKIIDELKQKYTQRI